MKAIDRIEIDPRVCNGKPVIRGTRIPVSVILEQVAEGISWTELISDYPELKQEDIKAALVYAKEFIEHSDMKAAYA
jgi:uncharacterized protein (DUF433 family)